MKKAWVSQYNWTLKKGSTYKKTLRNVDVYIFNIHNQWYTINQNKTRIDRQRTTDISVPGGKICSYLIILFFFFAHQFKNKNPKCC